MDIMAQIFGVLGIITTIFVYQQKERKLMLLWKIGTDAVWTLHYLLLGATSAVAVTLVAIIRSIVFLNYEHKWAQTKAWLAVFLVICVGFSAVAWEGALTLLTLMSSMASIIAYWIGKPKLTRIVSIPVGIMFFTYTVISGSLLGSVCEFFIIVSSVVGIIRLDIKKKGDKKATGA